MTTTIFSALTCALFCLAGDETLRADGQDAATDKVGEVGKSPATLAGPTTKPGETKPAAAKTPPEKQSLAERIAHLQRSIESDQKSLEQIKEEEESPESEYRKAEASFQVLDTHWTEKTKKLQVRKDAGDAEEVLVLEKELSALKRQRELAKDRFDLTIQERKTLRAKAVVLRLKVQQDQRALSKLTGEAEPAVEAAPPGANSAAKEKQPAGPPVTVNGKSAPPSVPTPTNPLAFPGITLTPPTPIEPAVETGPDGKPAPAKPAPEQVKPVPKELIQARADAKSKEVAATEAKDKVENVTERVDGLRKNIGLEQKLLETARKKAQQAQEARVQVDKDLNRARKIDPTKAAELVHQRDEITERIAKATEAIQTSQDRLSELQTELTMLQQEQIVALREADQKRGESERAQKKVERLQNPFTPQNIWQWLVCHGPKLAAICLCVAILHLLVRLCSRHIAQVMARSSDRGTEHDRENRLLTLVSVLRNTAALAFFGGAIFLILDEVEIPIVPLMGGAAVIGLAVAFGAQNLIRDYFSGFMVLMEDQYGINDVVRIGDIAGVVEKITLRMTVLRDIRGIVHFVPHGTIQRVSNLTHGWSRAYFEIGIAYKEDPDRVMELLVTLAKEMRQDPVHGPDILEDPEMLGVDSFGDSKINICFFLKTRPLKQWPVQRELLLRIKRKFNELKIEIPFPHRTIYHHYENEIAPRMSHPHHGDDAELAA